MKQTPPRKQFLKEQEDRTGTCKYEKKLIEFQRKVVYIADDYHPSHGEDPAHALAEMREALDTLAQEYST